MVGSFKQSPRLDDIQRALELVEYGSKNLPLLCAAWFAVLFANVKGEDERALVAEQEARGWEEPCNIAPRLDAIGRRATDPDAQEIVRRARGFRLTQPSQDAWKRAADAATVGLLRQLAEAEAGLAGTVAARDVRLGEVSLARYRALGGKGDAAAHAEALQAAEERFRVADEAVRVSGRVVNGLRRKIDGARRAVALAHGRAK